MKYVHSTFKILECNNKNNGIILVFLLFKCSIFMLWMKISPFFVQTMGRPLDTTSCFAGKSVWPRFLYHFLNEGSGVFSLRSYYIPCMTFSLPSCFHPLFCYNNTWMWRHRRYCKLKGVLAGKLIVKQQLNILEEFMYEEKNR